MPHGYRIQRLQHYGMPFKDEEELAVAFRFYQYLGFTYVIKDAPRVKWLKLEDGSELHLFVDDNAPCPTESNMVHGNFLVDNIEMVETEWRHLCRSEGWKDPVTGKRYPMKKVAYKDMKLPGVRGRIHTFDPWNNHIEFWELE